MKKRDIAKYALATVIAILTVVGIAAMTIAQNARRARTTEETERIRALFAQTGVGDSLPDRIEKHSAGDAGDARAPSVGTVNDGGSSASAVDIPPPTPFFKDVAHGLFCPCPECTDPLDECECSHALEIREFVETAHQAGKSVSDVRALLMSRYDKARLTGTQAR